MVNLLHIDDDIEFLYLIKIFAQKFYKSFKISSICDPREINSKYSIDDLSGFDAIISDYKMPYLNGKEVLSYLRNNYINTPFILCSSTSIESLDIKNEIKYFLHKTKNINSLFIELNDYLNKIIFEENNDPTHDTKNPTIII
ncbi:MAG: Regulator of RpoS [Candidatus Heimdallarchaeota archaeon LC_3]|nr:MAG: Regulator of RpoS [Candidatus Heimdallarchaeota archaeon LC_3]